MFGEASAQLQWLDPIEAARCYTRPKDAFALLLSGTADADGNQQSFLALGTQPFQSGDIDTWRWRHVRSDLPEFGFAGYECWQQLDPNPTGSTQQSASFIPLPLLWWLTPKTVLVFDHARETLSCYGEIPIAHHRSQEPKLLPKVIALGSSLSQARYLRSVEKILQDIAQGEYYQANLTRKIYGLWQEAPSPLDAFTMLRAISPAPYSALLSNGDWAIASSSMECFLKAEANGLIQTRPIKGSIRRSSDSMEDACLREQLCGSAKDHAENLMIVDLMRNDLAKHCTPGSVKVSALCALETYAQIHHLVSTVEAQKPADTPLNELILDCMPPGSMTGAPKRAAIHQLAELEPMQRGVYSGVLGWLGQNACDLSVVIRTLVMQQDRFEFQVGGGIVADSHAEMEWRESLLKAKGIAQLLRIEEETLAVI